MNTMRLDTALDRAKVLESRYQAPGLVSRTITRSDGLCSGSKSVCTVSSRVF